MPARSDPLHVTVIMPVRNEAAAVAATLDSVFDQSRPPDEVIVADGCSTDGTVQQVEHYAARGRPVRIVRNESRFCGGGRNAATEVAGDGVIVTMDFGNRAPRNWLEEMVRPFVEDPDLDLLGGLHFPITETPFARVSSTVVSFEASLLPHLSGEEIAGLVPEGFVPGGMCMAYRKRVWEQVGGFCEWARKGQDGLFGHRVRRLGGKVAYTAEATVYHHMPDNFRQLFGRHFHYALWNGRTGMERGSGRLVARWAGGLILTAAAVAQPWLWGVWLPLILAYIYRGAWWKLRRIGAISGASFTLRDYLLAVPILFLRDTAIVAGHVAGTLDRWLRPSWRSRTNAYLERGA